MSDRIKLLAEAMGWEKHPTRDYWRESSNQPFTDIDDLPDPFTDANDCNALIKHLNGLGYCVDIFLCASQNVDAMVDVWEWKGPLRLDWEGDNWMHGVCELALKVIE